jgi:hypothetical protein
LTYLRTYDPRDMHGLLSSLFIGREAPLQIRRNIGNRHCHKRPHSMWFYRTWNRVFCSLKVFAVTPPISTITLHIAAGTPPTVAGDIGGFNLSFENLPKSFEDLVDLVAQELRRRWVFPGRTVSMKSTRRYERSSMEELRVGMTTTTLEGRWI